jgi:Phosphopantetheine attachment site
MGQLMTSHRKPEDKAWDYMRPIASAAPYLLFDPIGDGKHECVVLSGLPTKVMSNSDNPPDSFRTRDTFAAHPNIPNAWKHLGRIDDRVTLVNGEKVLPVPYENQVRENELVKEACIFGVARAFPGICIFPSEKGAAMSKPSLLEALKPFIDAANARVEGFSQIGSEMIEIMDAGTEYPQTDKGTLIRAAFYKMFADRIDAVYKRFETFDAKDNAQQRSLSKPELETYLFDVFRSRIKGDSFDVDTDFFAVGVDSLQALAARGQILREINIGGKPLGQNAIFEYPNVRSLARHIYALRTGEQEEERSEIEEMRKLIEKYSSFPGRTSGSNIQPSEDTIVWIFLSIHQKLHCLLIADPHRHNRLAWSTYPRSAVGTEIDQTYLLPCPSGLPSLCNSPCSENARRQGPGPINR